MRISNVRFFAKKICGGNQPGTMAAWGGGGKQQLVVHATRFFVSYACGCVA